ncbi:hypothetical protein N665_0437s0021 [Sinapis alba]|nr:hypothetical protein N665_0437s0021 [Sinapis alba]
MVGKKNQTALENEEVDASATVSKKGEEIRNDLRWRKRRESRWICEKNSLRMNKYRIERRLDCNSESSAPKEPV